MEGTRLEIRVGTGNGLPEVRLGPVKTMSDGPEAAGAKAV